MLSVVASIFSLLLGIGTLLVGMGLLGTLLGLRANLEQFPEAVIGLVMSAYFVGFAVGTYLCPGLIRRVGHIRAFTALAAITSATALAHALLVDPWVWAALRIVNGIALVGLYMVIESWLNVLAPSHGRARFFSLYVAITLIAMGGGQYLILVGDIAGFVPFALAAMLMSLALVPVALTRVIQPVMVETPRLGLGHLFRVSPLGVVGAFVAGLVSGAFWGMGPVFAQRIGLAESDIALFMSLTIFGGALLQWPVGHLSDHYDRRRVLTAVSFAAGLCALVSFFFIERSTWGLNLSTFAYGGLAFTLYGLSVAHVNDYLGHEEVLEATRGLLLLYGGGAIAGPILAGLFMNRFGPGVLLLFFAVALVGLGLYALYRMLRREAVPVEEQAEFVPMVRTSQAALELDPWEEEAPAVVEKPRSGRAA